MCSYCIVIMVIHHLQRQEKPILPYLQQLYPSKENAPKTGVDDVTEPTAHVPGVDVEDTAKRLGDLSLAKATESTTDNVDMNNLGTPDVSPNGKTTNKATTSPATTISTANATTDTKTSTTPTPTTSSVRTSAVKTTPRFDRKPKHIVDGYDTYFLEDLDLLPELWPHETNSDGLGQLLSDFFRYFAYDFPYADGVVSIRCPGGMKKIDKCWHVEVHRYVQGCPIRPYVGFTLNQRVRFIECIVA